MAFFFETSGDFGEKFIDVIGDSTYDFDCCEDGFLANVGRTVAAALYV